MSKVRKNYRLHQAALNQVPIIQKLLREKGLILNETQVIEYLLMRGQDFLLDERDQRNMVLDKELF